jgi:hypothetical protein
MIAYGFLSSPCSHLSLTPAPPLYSLRVPPPAHTEVRECGHTDSVGLAEEKGMSFFFFCFSVLSFTAPTPCCTTMFQFQTPLRGGRGSE